MLKYFSPKAVIAEKHCLWADFPSVASVVRFCFREFSQFFQKFDK